MSEIGGPSLRFTPKIEGRNQRFKSEFEGPNRRFKPRIGCRKDDFDNRRSSMFVHNGVPYPCAYTIAVVSVRKMIKELEAIEEEKQLLLTD